MIKEYKEDRMKPRRKAKKRIIGPKHNRKMEEVLLIQGMDK